MNPQQPSQSAVTLLAYSPDPEKTVAAAARLCYSDSDIAGLVAKFKESDHVSFLQKIMELGHFSVLEHISFTFGVEGISRACSHQLVRHRLASFSQQSQRYVDASAQADDYIVPQSVIDAGQQQRYKQAMESAWAYYRAMRNAGVPAEDARFVLPNAAETKMVLTMNARELLHFFNLRCCNRAQWEIRALAEKMLEIVHPEAPTIFSYAGPPCLHSACPEGSKTCGQAAQVKEKYARNWKKEGKCFYAKSFGR
ncbi:FAD-dependent thymidylate synthase [Geoalkalibacter subterraneus]|uniref:FAD-dependent thymidylate synthase n=1 Tax=Geoalkalibacter subterraneus TaxID=483547 RepID=UPI0006939A41|nr:FAD-dependent thymidylate synthase [Geoalkalibacter subterraneus]